jgi:hypothetical protein
MGIPIALVDADEDEPPENPDNINPSGGNVEDDLFSVVLVCARLDSRLRH